MASGCPAAGPRDPIVHALLGVVDCNVRNLTHDGYSTLFAASSPYSSVLTLVLTVYVALIGYQLMLGRTQLRVTDFALSAVKLGAVLALATQWDTYQAVVYRFLFQGPETLAATILHGIQPAQSEFRGSVFDGLQRAFDDLSGFANGYAAHAPAGASPLLGGTGFGALVLTGAATLLLLSSLGVLLAAKIVLGLLLAVGPIFIVLFLFEATRGLFEGWARASIAFALAPLTTTLLLGLILTMLEPSLLEIETLRARNIYELAPAYSVLVLVLVFVGVALAALIACAVIAGGLRLPSRRAAAAASTSSGQALVVLPATDSPVLSRAMRTAAAAGALERHDSLVREHVEGSHADRRTVLSTATSSERGGASDAAVLNRLGQAPRRGAQPRSMRPAAESGNLRDVR